MPKINGKVFLSAVIWLALLSLLIYSRFVNLGWGLPYLMHPDERNMANAIQQLHCVFSINNFQFKINDVQECFNPHFFAYGQVPLYLGYILLWMIHGFKNFGTLAVNNNEAVLVLRIISASASIVNAYILIKLIKLVSGDKKNYFLIFLLAVLSPFFIQFSHFGTTESLLMLFYSSIVYFSLKLINAGKENRQNLSETYKTVLVLALISGLAIATKISSGIFIVVPLLALLSHIKDGKKKIFAKFFQFVFFGILFALPAVIITLIFSPQNLINLKEFIGSMSFESDVALGRDTVFYTRQFFNTIPVWFQFTKIFPYVFGWPVFISGLLGFFGLSWNNKYFNFLRAAILIYFLPTAIIFAKWSRFMTPIMPLILAFAVLVILNIKNQISKIQFKNQKFYIFICHFTFYILIFAMIVPGLAYLHIYQTSDIRFQATDWIYKNIPENSYILSETANVVDIPVGDFPTLKFKVKNYQVISFNFYDLDIDQQLQDELKSHLANADYIFVPSRRIFANETCQKDFFADSSGLNWQPFSNKRCQILEKNYPMLNQYYSDLLSGKSGFREVAEFNSFPKICLPLTNNCLVFADEQAEETWTVFDHPVIRIYKRISI